MLVNRRLYRSRTDTVIGGVAAGLANYMNTDPALVRVGWVVVALITNGVGLIAYLVAWVAIPEEPKAADSDAAALEPDAVAAIGSPNTPDRPKRRETNAGVIVGVGLVLLGAWFLVREYLPPIDWSLIWPVVLIGIGVLVLVTSSRRRTDA
jgi:phage shock protein C